ncbi:MAG: iron-containing redox enzyme family protein [Pirellulales bacterium]|nr:iron-containing redox enzyme family protein [Pirellulales bacterium]
MIALPTARQQEFVAALEDVVSGFGGNPLFASIDAGTFEMRHYHRWLQRIFHLSYHAPQTFALAAGYCDYRLQPVRDYLITHAEEERTHWRWSVEDLEATGYAGPDPRSEMPPLDCQNYVAFTTFLAVRMPVARLGTAVVLEGVGARWGAAYGRKVKALLNLQPQQMSFSLGHGDVDAGHTADIMRVLDEAELTGHEWAWLTHAVRTANELYTQVYASVVT